MPPSSSTQTQPVTVEGAETRSTSGTSRPVRVPFSAHGGAALACHGVMIMLCISVLVPFLLIISGSLTNESVLQTTGFELIPSHPSTAAYDYVFSSPDILFRAYGVTLFVTAVGTAISLLLTVMLGYVLARPDYAFARVTTAIVFFTLLFNGGLVPFFILMTRYLHLQDSIWAMIVPGLLAPFNVLIVKGFMNNFSFEVIEAAQLDGASEFRVFFQIVMPMIKPVLSTLAVLISFSYWNEYFNALLFITNTDLYPIQLMLYHLSSTLSFLQQNPEYEARVLGLTNPSDVPFLSAQLAIVILATVPFVTIFSFLRRYFWQGLTVSSVRQQNRRTDSER